MFEGDPPEKEGDGFPGGDRYTAAAAHMLTLFLPSAREHVGVSMTHELERARSYALIDPRHPLHWLLRRLMRRLCSHICHHHGGHEVEDMPIRRTKARRLIEQTPHSAASSVSSQNTSDPTHDCSRVSRCMNHRIKRSGCDGASRDGRNSSTHKDHSCT